MNKFPLVVVPTFYPGVVIKNLFDSININYEILILDNGNDEYLNKIVKENKKNKIYHEKLGDIGLAKSFNYALKNYEREFFFITQPDVVLQQDCIENLIIASKKYTNAAIISPLIYNKGKYHKYDFYDLSIDKKTKKIHNKKNNTYKEKGVEPSGDICVEAVNSTAILIDKKKIQKIGGWDNNFYTYLEDIDLCYRARLNNFEIIKVFNAKVEHAGFESHDISRKNFMNQKRIYNFELSQIYFAKKHFNSIFFYYYAKKFFKTITKIFIYILIFRKNKILVYFYRLKAIIDFLRKL